MEREIKTWRRKRPHKPAFIDNPEAIHDIPATKFFDQLSYVGNSDVGSFILETSEGLVMIDCGWPTDERVDMIERGIRDLGFRPEDLIAVIISHGHGDHWGKADHFRDKYGAKVYMSKRDYDYARSPVESPRRQLQYEVFDFLSDGDILSFGESSVVCVQTPGHTPGCMSFIIPVTDEGRPHYAGLFGGTGVPMDAEMKKKYLESAYKFREVCTKYHVDVALTAHPFVDNGEERLALCRCIVDGVANPFIIGEDAYHRFEDMFIDLVKSKM